MLESRVDLGLNILTPVPINSNKLGNNVHIFMTSVEKREIVYNTLVQGSSTRGLRAACGPRASFVRPEKSISQNTMRYEY